MKQRPLFKFEEEEYINKRDGTICTTYTIWVKFYPDDMYIEVYNTSSRVQAQLAYEHLKSIADVYLYKLYSKEEDAYTMFEYADQIYKTTFVCFNQSCICGEDISGNQRYGEFSPDGVKHDYALNIIFFYPKNHCLIKSNQVFMNGELLLNSKELDEVCKKIGQNKSQLDTNPDKFVEYIQQNYPEVQSYECNWYTRYMKEDNNG